MDTSGLYNIADAIRSVAIQLKEVNKTLKQIEINTRKENKNGSSNK